MPFWRLQGGCLRLNRVRAFVASADPAFRHPVNIDKIKWRDLVLPAGKGQPAPRAGLVDNDLLSIDQTQRRQKASIFYYDTY